MDRISSNSNNLERYRMKTVYGAVKLDNGFAEPRQYRVIQITDEKVVLEEEDIITYKKKGRIEFTRNEFLNRISTGSIDLSQKRIWHSCLYHNQQREFNKND